MNSPFSEHTHTRTHNLYTHTLTHMKKYASVLKSTFTKNSQNIFSSWWVDGN